MSGKASPTFNHNWLRRSSALAAAIIPPIGFGTWPLKDEVARDSVAMALDCGFRHIDTAQAYDNEKAVGEGLRASSLRREEIFLVTKVHFDNLNKSKFLPSVRGSLGALKVDRVDLLLIHWPPRDDTLFDPAVDALCEAQSLGLAKHVGVSNFTPKLLRRAANRAKVPLIANQVEFHPLIDQTKLLAAARELSVTLEAYCVLGRGKVLGQAVIQQIAERRGLSEAAVILRWVMQKGVVPLVQTTKRKNAEGNLAALDFTLSELEMNSISSLNARNERFISGGAWAPDWNDGT
jgi:2,5-diketo-D-gluconate reductase B